MTLHRKRAFATEIPTDMGAPRWRHGERGGTHCREATLPSSADRTRRCDRVRNAERAV